jgi:hypothetical protein
MEDCTMRTKMGHSGTIGASQGRRRVLAGLGSGAAVAACLLFQGNAWGRLHPGQWCKPATSNAPNVEYQRFGITNTSLTEPLQVICPGPKYSTDSLAPTASPSINVLDQTTTRDDFVCGAAVLDTAGDFMSISPIVVAPHSQDTAQTLSMTATGAGTLQIHCTIPPATPGVLNAVFSYDFLPNLPSQVGGRIVHSGVQCVPAESGQADIGFSQFGVHNSSTTSQQIVNCAGARVYSDNTSLAKVTVYDRTVAPGDLCCNGFIINNFGTSVASSSRCATGFGSASELLDMNVTGAGRLYLQCRLPPRDAQNGMSHIASYRYDNF